MIGCNKTSKILLISLCFCMTNVIAEGMSKDNFCNNVQLRLIEARQQDLRYIEYLRDQKIQDIRGNGYSQERIKDILNEYQSEFNQIMITYQNLSDKINKENKCLTNGYGG